MIRTFNRRPYLTDLSDKKDIKNYFFNTVEWHGLCTDKNFLGIDQYSFESCNNIYIDKENVLKSRPPIKTYNKYNNIKIKSIDEEGNEVLVDYSIQNIVNIWNFSGVTVIQYSEEGSYFLAFVQGDNANIFPTHEKILPIFQERKIFVFSEEDLMYYDIDAEEKDFLDASKYVYVPVTKISTNNVESNYEEPNELTSSYVYRYTYSSSSNVNFSELIGKTVVVNIAGVKYTIENFKKYNQKVFVRPTIQMNNPYLSVSEKGTYITYDNGTITYFVNDLVKEVLPALPPVYGNPLISQDGSYVVAFLDDGPYAYSVLSTEETKPKWTEWTKLPLPEGFPSKINNNYDIAGKFVTEDNYVFVVTDNTAELKTWLTSSIAGKLSLIDISSVTDKLNYTDNKILDFVSLKGQTGMISLLASNDLSFTTIWFSIDINTSDGSISGVTYRGDSKVSIADDISGIELYNTNPDILIEYTDKYNEFVITIACAGRIGDLIIKSANITSSSSSTSFTYNLSPWSKQLNETSTYFKLSKYDNSLLTENYLWEYDTDETIPLLITGENLIPLYNYNSIYLYKDGQLYTSTLGNLNIEIDITYKGEMNYKLFSHFAELNSVYFSEDNVLYISQAMWNDNKEFLFYLPSINKQHFNDRITNLHAVSKTEMGIFFEDSIWYCTLSELGYRYTKSKIQLGCKEGSDVITSYDGKYIVFPTKMGLVQMSYQDFVSSTEQTLTYLSESIMGEFLELYKKPIKIFPNHYWYVCYNEGEKTCLILDVRNTTWWPWSYNKQVQKIINDNETIVILSRSSLYDLRTNTNNYYDDKDKIDWHFTSQKLHFNAINNYKSIINITINAVNDSDNPFTMDMIIKNYREVMDEKLSEVIEYTVDVVRTFVKRVNFSKVNEFQYTLKNDELTTMPSPLSITSLTVKYKIGSEVR